MTLTRNSIGDDVINVAKLSPSVKRGAYIFDSFQQEPLCTIPGATLTEPAGTSLQPIRINSGVATYEFAYIGDATAAMQPTFGSEGGLNFGALATDGLIGAEFNVGGVKDGHPRNFIAAGSSGQNWFFRALYNVNNWSGVDILHGFKKATATYVATLTELIDIFGVRALGDSSSALAALSVVYNQNNEGTTDATMTAIDTGSLTDATTVEFEVRAVGGKAEFYVNGLRKLPGLSISFDSGDVLMPVVRLLQTTDNATQVKLLAIEAGPLEDRSPLTLFQLAGGTT